MNIEDIATFAARIRRHALCMVHHAGASHIGTCLSMADLLWHYRNPDDDQLAAALREVGGG